MSLIEYWVLLRKNWILLVGSALLGIVVGAGVSWFQPTLYTATSTGYVVAGGSSSIGDAFAGSTLAAEKAETYLPLVKSRSVAERVAKELSLDSIDSLKDALEGKNDGVIFNIKATASSPELAAQLADAAIRATSIEANALETMTLEGEESGKTVVRISRGLAQTPTSPVSPRWKVNLARAAVGSAGRFWCGGGTPCTGPPRPRRRRR